MRYAKKSKIIFGSKADTLEQFKRYLSRFNIPDFYHFNLKCWEKDSIKICRALNKKFRQEMVAVRSSALCEDGAYKSFAGSFTSVLNVNASDQADLHRAIGKVFASYPDRNTSNQVLIQKMVKNIDAAGVILTRCVDDGSPYYVINYDDETGNSDSVTAGRGVHKTVLVYRNFKPEYCDSNRVKKMLRLAGAVEALSGGIPLDIEFALDKSGDMHLLQARRISTVASWHPDTEYRVSRSIPHIEQFITELSARRKRIFGDFTILGNMPDWNPAELIGVIPSPLAASLFRLLITSHAWSVGRSKMGYRHLPKTDLMVIIAGRPFIDVRACFNSFLPEGIPDEIGEKLINAWLQRLADNPMLHDKVEFEIAHTVLDFSFDSSFKSRYGDVLSTGDKQHFVDLLRIFTNKTLNQSGKDSLSLALNKIKDLASWQADRQLFYQTGNPAALAAHISALLDDCLQYGTIPFTIIARHAFIAESLLRSAVKREAITSERVATFKSSFRTIMADLAEDTLAVINETFDEQIFHARYGHLRPGTFDIMSPCYRDRSDLFANGCSAEPGKNSNLFELSVIEENALNVLLKETGIDVIDAKGLLEYTKKAIKGREYAKFVFTRNISAALESIAQWGSFFNLGREDLSYLCIHDILDTAYCSSRSEITSALMHKADQARVDHAMARVFKLTYLIRGVRDIHLVPIHRSEPNFITQKKVEKSTIFLNATSINHAVLKDRIILITNADPGFDWIFTKGIAGLITQFGGANSHMAIRCAELQLPAAIGCGEVIFEQLRKAPMIDLNCGSKTIRPLGIYE
jgi:glutamine kinase